MVTVHRDDFQGLERTWRSLQPWLSRGLVQWLVVDGGSVPATAAEAALLDRVRAAADQWLSGPDRGPYDAMNKGTALASFDYVLYLNAGDELNPELDADAVFRALADAPQMLWGVCLEVYENGQVVALHPRPPRLAWYGMPVNHQNILFQRQALDDAPYRLDYPIAADYELVCRLLAGGARVTRSGLSLARFHRGGASGQDFSATLREEQRVRRQYFAVSAHLAWLIMAFKQVNSRIARLAWLRRWWRKRL